jgi:hypothetical protein
MSAMMHTLRECPRSELHAKLFASVPVEARESVWRITRALDNASRSVAQEMPRRANVIGLLYLDALNPTRDEERRERRWRRFFSALTPFANDTHSLELRRIVYENTDLFSSSF